MQIDAATMEPLVARALMEGITQEQRDQILLSAVSNLITTPSRTGGYSSTPNPSPLQEAMNIATADACRTVVRETIDTNTELRDRIRVLVNESIADLMSDGGSEKLRESVRDAISNTLTNYRSYDY